jgi:hypothetical protein
MRVRMVRQPTGIVQSMSMKYYPPGEVYDLPPSLAEYLVMEKFAIIEMRDTQRTPVSEERRRRA